MDASVIGVLGTVLGVFLAGPITYHFSKVLVEKTHKNAMDIIQRQEFNKAGAELRFSFCKIITGIKTGKLSTETEIRSFAQASIVDHTIGFERFRFYVPDCEKEQYDKACDEYSNMVSLRPINHDSDLSADKYYIEKVEAIFNFSKTEKSA